ncbi:Hsp20/alpha crystallin family protein [Escherichia coli]|uniref:Hsp20/alpha crystallin family protein n=1 Tax=Escherichia coli TaxID=562 RepID=UPI003D36DD5D
MRERRYGSFERRITLPADADASDITAKIKRGVLTIVIGKDTDAASRTRKVTVEEE